MTNNERIAKEIMGWEQFAPGQYGVKLIGFDEYKSAEPLNFDTNLNTSFLMEEKIKEKGWEGKYIDALLDCLSESESPKRDFQNPDNLDFFSVAHANPQIRVEVAIRMLDEMKCDREGK